MGVKTAQVNTYPQKNHPGQSCSHWAARIPAQAAQTYPCCKPLICQHKNLLSTAQAKPYYYYYLNIEVLVEQLNPQLPKPRSASNVDRHSGSAEKTGNALSAKNADEKVPALACKVAWQEARRAKNGLGANASTAECGKYSFFDSC